MYLQRIYAVERSGNDNISYIDSLQLRSVILLQNEEPSPPESPTPTHGGYINDSSWWMEKCDIVDTFCYLDSVLSLEGRHMQRSKQQLHSWKKFRELARPFLMSKVPSLKIGPGLHSHRVGIDLIKLIKSLIKSMRINQGIDLFDFFKIICTHVITDA